MNTNSSNSTVTIDQFRALFRNHPAGVAVITAEDDNGPVAMTASSLISVNADPPIIVFSASGQSSSTPTLLNVDTIVIHMIDVDSIEIAKLGATSGIDRFEDVSTWDRLPSGEPYFHVVPTRVRGRILQTVPAGDSTIFVVELLEAWVDPNVELKPLVYHARAWHGLSESSQLA